MKTYTEDEVKELVKQALLPFTTESRAEHEADKLFAPKMNKLQVEDLRNGVFRISAYDDSDIEWQVLDISAKGVFFHRNISEESGWNLDIDGEMQLTRDRYEL